MSVTKKIRIVMLKREIKTDYEMARLLDISKQYMSKKFKKDIYTTEELKKIAEILNCDLEINFIMKDTGEKI